MKKVIISGGYFIFIAIVLVCPFFIGLDAIKSVLNKPDIVFMSYGAIFCLISPVISYFLIDVALRGVYYFFVKKTKIKKTYKLIGIIITLWIFLSFPISWGMSFYLTSNGYERCPSTNLFTQYYTTNLSLCSDPYYEERASTE